MIAHFHEKGQSTLNYKVEQEQAWKLVPGYGVRNLKSMLQTRITSKSYKCNDKGTSSLFQCANEFYMKKLNCSFPWIENHTLTQCNSNGTHDIDTLLDLFQELQLENKTLKGELESMK